jgi:hypothetical protein
MNEDERAAARAIRAGSRKKKLRKKRRPIYTRPWFGLIAAVGLVVGLGWFIYKFGFAPPPAESLLAELDNADDPDIQKKIVEKYLKHYGRRDDDATKKVKALDRRLKVEERERVLLNRHGIDRLRGRAEEDDDKEAYQKTMYALTAENDGDLAAARTAWTELADRYSKEPGEAKALWGWVAQKKLDDLAAKKAQLDQLYKKLEDEFRLDDKDPVFTDDLQQRVVNAHRAEQLGDFALAHDRWNQIAKTLEGDKERRPEFVLARARVKDLEGKKSAPKDAAERAALIGKVIERARPLLKDQIPARRRDARNLLRDVRDLYAGETGPIADLVAEAKKLLADHPT